MMSIKVPAEKGQHTFSEGENERIFSKFLKSQRFHFHFFKIVPLVLHILIFKDSN